MGVLEKVIVNFNHYNGAQALQTLINLVGIEEIEEYINEYSDNNKGYIANRDDFESEPE